MSGIANPVASAIALPVTVAMPSVIAPGVPSLAAFVDLITGKLTAPGVGDRSGTAKRQNSATTGKDLPAPDDKPTIDPALAWLFGAPPVPVQPPTLAALATPKAPPVMRDLDSGGPAAAPVPVSPMLRPDKPVPMVLGPGIDVPAPFVGPLPPPLETKTKPDIMPALPFREPPAVTTKPDVSPMLSAPPLVTPVAPAASPATAVLPALFALARTADHEARDDATPSLLPAAATVHAVAVAAVQPTGDARHQALDMGNRDWPQKMIDHIETLRDNANATDTSIRLKPEALGRVDVSLKSHADGAVSVRFTAEQPATRTLLIDAAPQLTAAADARGIRLSGTSVDLTGQGDHRPRPEIDRREPITNRVAPAGDEPEADPVGRIA